MKKMEVLLLRRIMFVLFTFVLLAATFAPMTLAASDVKEPVPTPDERIVGIFESNHIEYQIKDGKINLVDNSEENRIKVNKILIDEYNANENLQKAAITYPTPYTHMGQYDILTDSKFEGATKTAFVAAFTAWAKSIVTPWQELVAVAAGGYAGYYFINSHVETLYISIKYYYRTMGPGFVDENGTVYGDYEVLKETRVTKNSDYTGGQFDTDARRSTSLVPWF